MPSRSRARCAPAPRCGSTCGCDATRDGSTTAPYLRGTARYPQGTSAVQRGQVVALAHPVVEPRDALLAGRQVAQRAVRLDRVAGVQKARARPRPADQDATGAALVLDRGDAAGARDDQLAHDAAMVDRRGQPPAAPVVDVEPPGPGQDGEAPAADAEQRRLVAALEVTAVL